MYAIAGATGRTGGAAAAALLAKGEQVRVIVRDPSWGEPWRIRGAEVAVADLRNPTALAAALHGADGAYLLIPTEVKASSLATAQQAYITGISEALETSRIPHVVLLSSMGAELPSGTGPIAELHRAEQALHGVTRTNATLLRAAYFMENVADALGMLEQNLLPTFLPEELAIPMVATQDIGNAAARLLADPPEQTRVVYVTGPTEYSYADAAAILSNILHREIRPQRAPLDAMVPVLTGTGVSADVANAYREMTAALAAGRIGFEPEAERITGTTPLETVLRFLVRRPDQGA